MSNQTVIVEKVNIEMLRDQRKTLFNLLQKYDDSTSKNKPFSGSDYGNIEGLVNLCDEMIDIGELS